MLELKDIKVKRGDFELKISDLRVQKGECIAVIGNNGSGKSTFVSLLAGLLKYEGSYKINGMDFSRLDTETRNRLISLLPQEANFSIPFDVFYIVLTGRYPLTDGRSYSRIDREKTVAALKMVDVWHLRDRHFNTLSGGQKRRALIARTINREAMCVLLDEPFSGVDLKHQYEIIELLKGLKKDSIIFVVLHDLSIALAEFERLLCFRDGQLVYDLSRDRIDDTTLSEVFNIEIGILRHEYGTFIYRRQS